MSPLHIVVLAGGISHERDVSLRSGRRVADALAGHGVEVELRDPDASLLAYLREHRPDVVWPALHGASGEDGALRGLLEFLGIPFVGSRSGAAWALTRPVMAISALPATSPSRAPSNAAFNVERRPRSKVSRSS